eukprot:gene40120-49623_t
MSGDQTSLLANSPPSFKASPSSGWQVTYPDIPNYDHTFTASEISTLNSRPNAATDFETGVTTASESV